MGWVRIDDQFFRHRKVTGLAPGAKLLFIAGLAYCAGHLTDGFISSGALRIIAAEAGVKTTFHRQLIEVGLWHKREDGYDVHDFLIYHPSAAQEMDRRSHLSQVRAAAGRRGGQQTASKRGSKVEATETANGAATGQAKLQQPVKLQGSPDPEPLSLLSSYSDSRPSLPKVLETESDRRRATQLAEFLWTMLTDAGGKPKPTECVDVVWWALEHLDSHFVDEVIGSCAELADKPRSARYVAKVIHQRAGQRGIDIPEFVAGGGA